MNFDDHSRSIWALFNDGAMQPLARFFLGLNQGERTVLYVLLGIAIAFGFLAGRNFRIGARRAFAVWRFDTFQNSGERHVSRVLLAHFGPPDYHLMNHVTLGMEDGTTQIDHILVSRFGVFVIETKDYSGWIFANPTGATWTQVLYRRKFKLQNPILQNKRHVRAVQGLLEFLPPGAIQSVVVFSGKAEFKTERPQGVLAIAELAEYLKKQTEGDVAKPSTVLRGAARDCAASHQS